MTRKTRISIQKVFLFCIVLCLTALSINSCKKTDALVNTPSKKEFVEETPQNFFNLPANASPVLKRIAEELARQNKSKEFVTAFIAKEGFPTWSKSRIERHKPRTRTAGFDGDGLEDTTVYIPLIVSAQGYVTGFLKATVRDSVDIKIFRQNDYVNFPFKTPLSSANVTTAEEFATRMMGMDKDVFGTTEFEIKDKRMFNNSTNYSDTGVIQRYVKLTDSSGTGGGDEAFGGTTISNYEYQICIQISEIKYICGGSTFSGTGPQHTQPPRQCYLITYYNFCTTYETESGGGGSGSPGGGSGGGGAWPFPPSGGGGSGGAPCTADFGKSIANSLIPIECNPSGGNPWPSLPSAVQYLKTTLGLDPVEVHWLLQDLSKANQIYNYLTVRNGSVEIAKDHITNMMDDSDYLLFENNHAYNGNNSMMWWEDDSWIKQNMRFDIDEGVAGAPPQDATDDELFLLKYFPVQGYKIYRNASKAQTETVTRFGTNGLNDKSDAFRHAFWLAINTKSVGADLALAFSNAHESEVPSKFQKEKTMDLYNNGVGISLCTSSSLSISALSQACMNAVTAGSLRYLDPINYSDPCFWGCSGNSTGTHGISTLTQLKPTDQ